VRAAIRGHHLQTEAAPVVAEYLDRMKLTKLGYRFDSGLLDCDKAEAFVIVADEIDKAKADEQERLAKKRRR
jgi:hypothetical protein